MMFGGMASSGGGGGGDGRRTTMMIRIVGRAVTSCSVPTSTLSSSSSLHKHNNHPLSLSSNSSLSSPHTNTNSFPFSHSHHFLHSPFLHNNLNLHCTQLNDYVFHHLFSLVPSQTEVDAALSALHQVFGPASHSQLGRDKSNYKLDNELDYVVSIPGLVDQVSSDGSDTDWKEPSLFPYNSQLLQADGSDTVHYAFHLLQTEPYVQKMVKSLSSDKAVWDAVLNNEVVRELRESISADVFQNPDGTNNSDSRTTTNVVMWIFDTVKAKFMEVIEIITKVVVELFQPADHKTVADAEGPDPINDNLRTAFMLSIMVLLVVLVSRAEARACHNLTT